MQSAKQLGADKRISMWQPDSQVGMVVLAAPPVPKIKHPIPIIKSRFDREDDEDGGAEMSYHAIVFISLAEPVAPLYEQRRVHQV